MIFGRKNRSLHWAEAFGASAVVHLIAAVLIFDLLDGLGEFDLKEQVTPEITLTSIVLDGDIVPQSDEPLGNAPLADLSQEGGIEEPVVEAPPASEQTEEPTPEPEPEPQVAEEPELVPETLTPVPAETVQAPRTLSPLRPQNGAAVAVAPVASAPTVRPVTSLQPAAPTVLEPRQTFQPPPQATAQAPSPDGPAAGGAVSALVTRIRAQLAEPCLLAIPQQGAGDTPELVMIASTETGMQRFADAVLTDLSPRPPQRSVLIDSRQCASLNYVRENPTYPAFRLSVGLAQSSVESGGNLTGTIGNTAGRYISLLLIDSNGVVQDVGQYLSFTGATAQFDVPLTRDGPARDTSQMLMALATAARPATLNTQNGQSAEIFFAALHAEIGPNPPLVIVPFDVR